LSTALQFLVALATAVIQWLIGRKDATPDPRVLKLEEAAAAERAERLRKIDEDAAAVRSPADADRLLRDITARPNTDD
jgi:hypothetical protein